MKKIKITSGKATMEAQLEDEPFTRALWEALPPFYRHEGLAWMNSTYPDGYSV